MDFARVVTLVVDSLSEAGHPCAVIGGVSMAAYGMIRTTLDLDLVTVDAAREHLVKYLESEGPETLHASSGYSNHLHLDPDLGRVDVVYVSGTTSLQMFADLRSIDGPGGLRLPVLRPEHLAAMKVYAIRIDPSRKFRELEDIRYLLNLPGVNREEIRRYFEKNGLDAEYAEL